MKHRSKHGIASLGWRAMLVLALALALGVGAAQAKKKPKPPPPPPPPPAPVDVGAIYYAQGTAGLFTMDSDGTGKTLVGATGEPSLVLHGGRRWFLEFREIPGETYPTPAGTQTTATWIRHELWAVPEFAQPGEAKQLTSDPLVQPNFLRDGDAGRAQPRWAVDVAEVDGKVSYVALRWDVNGALVDWGLHELHLDWSTMTATPAPAMIPVGPYRIVPKNGTRWIPVGYAWNPAGDAIAYSHTDLGGLRRVDAVDGWSTPDVLITGGQMQGLDWSPDGTQIAFFALNIPAPVYAYDAWKWDVETIGSTGSGRTVVVAHTRTSGASSPRWSPSGTHLAYTRGSAKRRRDDVPSTGDVYVVAADGTGATNLTGDVGGWPVTVAWRND